MVKASKNRGVLGKNLTLFIQIKTRKGRVDRLFLHA
jgi:hypothetical protein